MKKVHAKKLGISVLLLSVLVTGCGGGSNGITNTIDNNADAFTSAANANAKPQQGGVIQSSINNTSGLGVDTTKTTLDFKRVAGGQNVTVDTSDSDGMLEYPYGDDSTTIFDYEKTLDDGDFVVLGGVADYDTGANDYLSFGLWSYEAIDGTMSEVGAYAYGGDPFTQANIAELTGTANYEMEDGAIGAYIYNEGDGIDVLLGDVSLTANFDTDTISGNINRIRSLDDNLQEEPALDGFNIALQEADIDTTKEGGFWTGDTLTTNTQNTEQYEGKWGGQFYGNGDHPAFASGTFGGAAVPNSGAVGAFVGAFIAEKQ